VHCKNHWCVSRYVALICLAIAMWLIPALSFGADDNASPAEVMDAFNTAINRGDAKAAASLLTRDAIVFEMGLADRSRRHYEGLHLKLDIEFARTTTRTLVSRRQGADGSLHWILSLYKGEGTFEGKRVLDSTAETALLRQVAGRWRIAHLHWSTHDVLLEEAKPNAK
jgi:ketosteroid isomerase-like protein